MRIGVLGPLEIVGDDGRSRSIPGVKARGLLAILALRGGELVPADVLIDELWGDDAPADARNALQVLVRKLRLALSPEDVVVTQAPGYRLEVGPDDVDAHRFEHLVADERWHEALATWRGVALAEFVYEPFAQQPRALLDELRMQALERRIELDLERGLHESLVPELEALVAEHPVRERLHEQLMLALYRAGRQADALRAFQSARTVLGDELGLDPGPGLRGLESAILAQDPSLLPQAPVVSNLPPPLSSFVGRVDEVEHVCSLLDAHRIVTIVGPGGAGKTRIALEAARRVDVEAWLVELAPVDDPGGIDLVVAAALGLEDATRVDDFLACREALVVLDNCEHLVEAAARVATRLARAGERVTVLTTSRERLRVDGEHVWAIPPLSPTDAAALFTDRAASPEVVEDDALLAHVCERLDGLPLAVELAAARTRALALDDIAARLDDRFKLLTAGARTVEPRQQTLRNVVDWSHDLLFAAEQAVFRRLSVFTGGFGIDAAERVCVGGAVEREEVLDLVAHLADKSLVVTVPRARGSRYRMLETLAEYGRMRLEAAGETLDARNRHVAWIVALTADAEIGLRGPDQVAWKARLTDEQHNIRAAVEWALVNDPESALAVAKASSYAWYLDGSIADGHALLTRALALCPDAPADHRCTAHAWIGWFGQHGASSMDEAVDHIDRAVEIGRGGTVRPFVVACVFSAILGLDRVGPTGVDLLVEAKDRLDRDPDVWSSAMLGWAQGTYARNAGRVDEAAVLLRESIDLYDAVGDQWGTVLAAGRLGELALDVGRFEEAAEMMARAFDIIITTRTHGFQAAMLAAGLGHVAILRGNDAEADLWNERAISLATEGGFPRAIAQAFNSMGLAARRRGALEEAARLHREALRAFAPLGPVVGGELALTSLGTLAELAGDLDEATSLHLDGFAAARRANDWRPMATAIEGLAGVAAARNNAAVAAVLLGVADELRARRGGPLQPGERIDVDRIEARLRELLDEEQLAAGRGSGSARSVEVLELLAERRLPVE